MKEGVNIVIENDEGELLILKRSDHDEFDPGYWNFPGGGVEPGEGLLDAAKREAKEETNFDAEPEDRHFARTYLKNTPPTISAGCRKAEAQERRRTGGTPSLAGTKALRQPA